MVVLLPVVLVLADQVLVDQELCTELFVLVVDNLAKFPSVQRERSPFFVATVLANSEARVLRLAVSLVGRPPWLFELIAG